MKNKTASELNIPTLYHYQSFNKPEHLARIFTGETIYFSSPKDFNDPLDCCLFYAIPSPDDKDECDRTVRYFINLGRKKCNLLSEENLLQKKQEFLTNHEMLEEMINDMSQETTQEIQEKFRIYCLSTRPDSTLMWSHYSDSCKGICLEFSVKNELFCWALQDEYLNDFPLLHVYDTDDDKLLLPFLAKSFDWRYEKEFRIVVSEKPDDELPTPKDGFLPFQRDALQSVIVGPSMPEDEIDDVRKLVRGSGWNVELKKAFLAQGKYEFDIRPLE